MLSNSVAAKAGVEDSFPLCTLCGLLCETSSPSVALCDRLSRFRKNSSNWTRDNQQPIADTVRRFSFGVDTLIWLDACDVNATRAAVQLAQKLGATIHVGQSTGSHAVKNVSASEGWLGTTLSELPARAELIVTLGDSVRREAPLLSERFIQTKNRSQQPYWLHLSQHPIDQSTHSTGDESGRALAPNEVMHWPRDQWFDLMSHIALSVMDPSPPNQADIPSVASVVKRLQSANQIVIVWDVDDLHFQSDELLVRRMASIARSLSEKKRCALLPWT